MIEDGARAPGLCLHRARPRPAVRLPHAGDVVAAQHRDGAHPHHRGGRRAGRQGRGASGGLEPDRRAARRSARRRPGDRDRPGRRGPAAHRARPAPHAAAARRARPAHRRVQRPGRPRPGHRRPAPRRPARRPAPTRHLRRADHRAPRHGTALDRRRHPSRPGLRRGPHAVGLVMHPSKPAALRTIGVWLLAASVLAAADRLRGARARRARGVEQPLGRRRGRDGAGRHRRARRGAGRSSPRPASCASWWRRPGVRCGGRRRADALRTPAAGH